MNEFEKSIAEYNELSQYMSWKEKAESEMRLWESYKLNCVSHPDFTGVRRIWLKKYFSDTVSDLENRFILVRNDGDWSDHLWKMLDDNMSIFFVMKVFRDTKDLIKSHGIDGHRAFDIVISDYNNGDISVSNNGKLFRKKRPADPYSHQLFSKPLEVKPNQTSSPKWKEFLSKVSEVMLDFVNENYSNVMYNESEPEHKLALDEYLDFVKMATNDFKKNLSRSKGSFTKSTAVSHDQFSLACEVLNIPSTIKYGSNIDMKLYKKIAFKRAAALHPDRNNGSHSSVNEYQSVMESIAILEKYNDELAHLKQNRDTNV